MSGVFNELDRQMQAPAAEPVVALPPDPRTLPNFPVQPMNFDMGQGYGAARFLTGEAPIPLEFNVPQVTYTPYQFSPGDFESFRSAQAMGDSQNPVIPVYNPATGKYDAPQGTRRGGMFGGGEVIGYTQGGEPIYSSNPAASPFGMFGIGS